jgi:hypothetical protein
MKHTNAQIKAVEHDVGHDHYGNQPEPDKTHHGEVPFSSGLQGRAAIVIRR